MNIAFFNYLPMHYGGGLASYFLEITAGLRKRYPSIRPAIVTLDDKQARNIQRIYSFYFLRNEMMNAHKKSRHPVAHGFRDLGRLLQKYDVVYAKNDIVDLVILSIASWFVKLPPVIIGFHTPVHYAMTPTWQSQFHNILYSSLFYRFLLKKAAGFHVLNAFHEKKLKGWFPKKPVMKIFNPVDTSLFKPAKKARYRELKILWIGRLTIDKGADALVRLIREGRRRRVFFTVIGDGALRNRIDKLAESCNNVAYFPRMEHRNLASFYAHHDVFLTTSNWECLPYTVLEAQLSGTPVIGYDIPGVRDIVSNRKTGLLAKTEEGLSNRIDSFKSSKFRAATIAASVRKKFDTNISYKQLAAFLKTTYDTALS